MCPWLWYSFAINGSSLFSCHISPMQTAQWPRPKNAEKQLFLVDIRSKTSTLCACCSHATLLLERFRTHHMGKICRKLLEPHTWPKIKVSIENSLVENVLHGDWRVNLTNQNIMHLFYQWLLGKPPKKWYFLEYFQDRVGTPLTDKICWVVFVGFPYLNI